MIRQLTHAELTAEFGSDLAGIYIREGRIWADTDLLSGEVLTPAFTTRSLATAFKGGLCDENGEYYE